MALDHLWLPVAISPSNPTFPSPPACFWNCSDEAYLEFSGEEPRGVVLVLYYLLPPWAFLFSGTQVLFLQVEDPGSRDGPVLHTKHLYAAMGTELVAAQPDTLWVPLLDHSALMINLWHGDPTDKWPRSHPLRPWITVAGYAMVEQPHLQLTWIRASLTAVHSPWHTPVG